jgi:hypothetical protein
MNFLKTLFGGVSPSVSRGEWQVGHVDGGVEGSKIIRIYEFSGLPLPETTTSLRMECSVDRDLAGNNPLTAPRPNRYAPKSRC